MNKLVRLAPAGAIARMSALVAAATSALVSTAVMAQTETGPDFSSLTGAVSFDSVKTAILGIGVLVIGIALVTVGIRKIVRMIKGA